ncbi:hypothetical protein BDV95DRAFT_609472 [Massariosphaeria phaeospora]|uniref:Uncharacterized protein n=1 Tax=Massariosphaeria phaeospora TaxID=100035 RepID=A0A7C8I3Q2_9PLEO|nr:hypothetical protein BDV95DRAFT_609472 [Massariosphaeria phaeospora]
MATATHHNTQQPSKNPPNLQLPHPLPSTRPHTMPSPALPTHTIDGELHQISAYAEAMTTRLQQLEQLYAQNEEDAGEDDRGNVRETKLKVMRAHRRLEKLEARVRNGGFCVRRMSNVKREMWAMFKRLRALEGGTQIAGVVGKGKGKEQQRGGEERGKEMRFERSSGGVEDEGCYEGGEVLGRDSGMVAERVCGGFDFDFDSQDQQWSESSDGTPVTPEDVRMLTRAQLQRNSTGNGNDDGNDDSETLNTDSLDSLRKRIVMVLGKPLRAMREVEEAVHSENSVESVEIQHVNRTRKGSTDGWKMTVLISGNHKREGFYIPTLAYIKPHEAKALKQWLGDHGYLHAYPHIGRMEKFLYLLFVLQNGYRFEAVAVMFSRTPREVKSSCDEVFQGLLQMYAQTEVPAEVPQEYHVHCRLWRISERYGYGGDLDAAVVPENCFPWSKAEVANVLVALSLYVGRYRAQSQSSLQGPWIDWAKYLYPEQTQEKLSPCAGEKSSTLLSNEADATSSRLSSRCGVADDDGQAASRTSTMDVLIQRLDLRSPGVEGPQC